MLIISLIFILIYPIPLEYFSPLISPQFELFLFTFGRLIWTCCIIAIIFICHRGYGGIVNSFLSWKYFTPIAKMGLSFYLASAGIQYMRLAVRSEPQSIEGALDVIFNYLTDILIALPPIISLYFTIEAPFTRIGKILANFV